MRSRTIAPTCSELDVYLVVRGLFERARQRRLAVRLLGVGAVQPRAVRPAAAPVRRRSQATARRRRRARALRLRRAEDCARRSDGLNDRLQNRRPAFTQMKSSKRAPITDI